MFSLAADQIPSSLLLPAFPHSWKRCFPSWPFRWLGLWLRRSCFRLQTVSVSFDSLPWEAALASISVLLSTGGASPSTLPAAGYSLWIATSRNHTGLLLLPLLSPPCRPSLAWPFLSGLRAGASSSAGACLRLASYQLRGSYIERLCGGDVTYQLVFQAFSVYSQEYEGLLLITSIG